MSPPPVCADRMGLRSQIKSSKFHAHLWIVRAAGLLLAADLLRFPTQPTAGAEVVEPPRVKGGARLSDTRIFKGFHYV